MNMNNLEFVVDVWNRIKKIDQDINKIEKQASAFAESDSRIELSLTSGHYKEPDRRNDAADSFEYMRNFFRQPNYRPDQVRGLNMDYLITDEARDEEIKMELDPSQALEVLAILIASKHKERKQLLNVLKKQGVIV